MQSTKLTLHNCTQSPRQLVLPSTKDIIVSETDVITCSLLIPGLGQLYLNYLFENLSQVHHRERRNAEADHIEECKRRNLCCTEDKLQ